MLKLVLLDPHPVVQKGFKTFFENNDSIIVCDTFTSIDALFEFLSENELDVVIMEMELPDGSAVNTIKKIKKISQHLNFNLYFIASNHLWYFLAESRSSWLFVKASKERSADRSHRKSSKVGLSYYFQFCQSNHKQYRSLKT